MDNEQRSSDTNSVLTLERPAAPSSTPHRWRWLILFLVLAAEVMDLLDATIVNVASPSIHRALGGSDSMIQWIGAGYTLAFAIMLITGGRLGDIFGRKRMFVIGALGFGLASVACATAQDPAMLITSRILQGALGAMMIPQGFGILKAVFPPEETGKAFGLFGPVMGLSAVGGPILAGALIDADWWGTGWRMIFLINVPLMLFAVLGAIKIMPEVRAPERPRLDVLGMIFLSVASGLLIYPLIQGRELGWPVWIFGLIAGSLAFFGAFVAYERRRSSSPLIEAGLFAKKAFTGGLAVFLTFFGALTGFMLVFGLFVQLGLHYGPLKAGLASVPMALGITIGAIIGHPLTEKLGRRLIHLGLGIMAVAFGAFTLTVAHYGDSVGLWQLIPSTFVAGIGMGLSLGPAFGTILNGVADNEVGSASGVLNAVQQFAGALGIAVIGTVFFHELTGGVSFGTAMARTSGISVGLLVVCFGLVFLLPRQARAEQE
ncbi:DHA2 family efflux MFS transporter permease subunit [Hamadaea tsunoensis]|uniref:DHA2 family efflux MFS transporter permease subunit n=1 Tax=Hamadaea tsunoensis TaxID=53368 RepID=UPI00041E5576|nr:DHA2 family efflux MFS transporter permease subunit [Hamadaea tsunoensis]